MILKHNISFITGEVVPAGEKLTPDQVKTLKASGTKYSEVKAVKEKKEKAPKNDD
jgi:hypothetical protein